MDDLSHGRQWDIMWSMDEELHRDIVLGAQAYQVSHTDYPRVTSNSYAALLAEIGHATGE